MKKENNNPITEIPAAIAIESSITDLMGIQNADGETISELFGKFASDQLKDEKEISYDRLMNMMLERLGELNTEKISISTEGKIVSSSDRIELVYAEDAESGMEGCETRVLFDTADRNLVTMVRNGMSNASLVFSSDNKRQRCLYDTGIGDPFELCVVTRRIVNKLTESGGSRELEYLIEINGINAEYSHITLSATPFSAQTESNPTVIEYELP